MLGPLVGFTIARFGARKNIVAGNSIAVLGLLGMSQVREIWHVYLFFGIMGGLGLAFLTSTTTVINHWFIRKRSLALGFLFASGGAGGFFMPPLISFLMTGIGWRWTWVCLAGIHLLLGVVLAGWLIRNTPEEGRPGSGRGGAGPGYLPGTLTGPCLFHNRGLEFARSASVAGFVDSSDFVFTASVCAQHAGNASGSLSSGFAIFSDELSLGPGLNAGHEHFGPVDQRISGDEV